MLIFNPEKRFSSEKLVKLIENRPQFTIDKVGQYTVFIAFTI